MKARALILALSLVAAAATPASAHHSFAMYERAKTLTLTGTVKEFAWSSPHVLIQVLTGNARGDAMIWFIEGSSPTVLARGGWTGNLLKPGDKISLGIHPRKDGGAGGLLADEQQVLVNGQPAKGVQWVTPAGEDQGDK